MIKASKQARKDLHDLSGCLHNAYETLFNVDQSLNSDIEFCGAVIRAALKEKNLALAALDRLRVMVKERIDD